MWPFSAPMLLSSAQPSTWNPLDKDTSITLSNGNRTATKASAGGVNGNVRGSGFRSSGKHKFEITAVSVTGNAPQVGFATAAISLTGSLITSGAVVWYPGSAFRVDGVDPGSQSTFTTGDVLSFEMDFDNGQLFVQRYGAARSAAIAVTARTYFPIMAANAIGDAMTLNVGDSPFAIAATSGFSPWG